MGLFGYCNKLRYIQVQHPSKPKYYTYLPRTNSSTVQLMISGDLAQGASAGNIGHLLSGWGNPHHTWLPVFIDAGQCAEGKLFSVIHKFGECCLSFNNVQGLMRSTAFVFLFIYSLQETQLNTNSAVLDLRWPIPALCVCFSFISDLLSYLEPINPTYKLLQATKSARETMSHQESH